MLLVIPCLLPFYIYICIVGDAEKISKIEVERRVSSISLLFKVTTIVRITNRYYLNILNELYYFTK